MVLAQSLFKVLKQRHPDSTLDVLAPRWTLPLLERMPEVDESDRHGHRAWRTPARRTFAARRELRARGYDRAIVLPNSLKSAIVPHAARARVRTGLSANCATACSNDIRQLDKQKLPRTVDRFVALGIEPGAALPEIPPPRIRADMDKARMALARLGRSLPAVPALACVPVPSTVRPSAGRRNISPTWPRRTRRRLGGVAVRFGQRRARDRRRSSP